MRSAPAPERLGRYELLLKLGRGGMAELFLARLTAGHGFARFCAIKRILPHLADDPAFVAMFLNEGRIAARLSHPHVCAVHELIEHAGERALVMEYLAGVSFDMLAAAAPHDRFGARLAASVLAQACDGLHYAHTCHDLDGAPRGVVHRDVSPQNLFVTRDGVCKVLDFGVSKLASDPRRTATGVRKGKLPYMAPEQLRDELVDARADLWALGAVLWEALNGRRLFERATDFLTCDAILDATISFDPERDPEIARVLGPVIGRAVQRDLALRYTTARALADDLRRAADALGGALSQPEIAGAVRDLCAAPIAARGRQIAAVLGSGDAPIAAPAYPATASVVLRERTLAGASAERDAPTTITDSGARTTADPARRRWAWRAALALTGVAAGVLVMRDVGTPATATSAAAPPPGASLAPSRVEVATAPPRVQDTTAPSPPPVPAPASHAGASAPAPTPRPSPRKAPVHAGLARAAPAAAGSARPGYYAVDSRPYATIFVDGAQIGDTPLFKVPLAAGPHTVRAVLVDGRHRSFQIAVAPDREARSVLTW